MLALLACSDRASTTDDSGTSPVDLGPAADGSTMDLSPPSDGGADHAIADQAPPVPDGPKPPPHWQVVPLSWPGTAGHTATVLKNGKVLIAGGHDPNAGGYNGQPLDATYLYESTSDTLQPAGTLTDKRRGHTSALLDDGRVLVVGGWQESYYDVLSSCEAYTPGQPPASAWTTVASLSQPRMSHAMVKLANGKVLVLGGIGAAYYLTSLELYDPGANSWSTLSATLATPRTGPTATLLQDGTVLIVGGLNSVEYVDSVELFDPSTGSITTLPSTLTEGRAGQRAVRLLDGRVLLVGGGCGQGCVLSNNEIYDPVTEKLSPSGYQGSPPAGHTATLLADGRVVVTGGNLPVDRSKAVVFTTAMGGSWTNLPDLTYGRNSHSASLLADGSLLVIGGLDKDSMRVTAAERLYP